MTIKTIARIAIDPGLFMEIEERGFWKQESSKQNWARLLETTRDVMDIADHNLTYALR